MDKYARRISAMAESAAVVKGIFGALGDPDLISLAPDTAHIAAAGADPVAMIRKYANRVKFIHLKDYKLGDSVTSSGWVDSGVPIMTCFHELGEDVFHADVFVLQAAGQLFGLRKGTGQTLSDADGLLVHAGTADGGALIQRLFYFGGHEIDACAHALEDAGHKAFLLAQKGKGKVFSVHFLMAAGKRKVLGRAQGFLRLDGKLVHVHNVPPAGCRDPLVRLGERKFCAPRSAQRVQTRRPAGDTGASFHNE